MSLIAFAAKTGASIAAEKVVSKKMDDKKKSDEAKRQNAENLRKWAYGEQMDPKTQKDVEDGVIMAEVLRNSEKFRKEYGENGGKDLTSEQEEALKHRCIESGKAHIKSRLEKGEEPYNDGDFAHLKKDNAKKVNADIKKDMKNARNGVKSHNKQPATDMSQRMFGHDKYNFAKDRKNNKKNEVSSFEQAVRSQNANLQNEANQKGLHGRTGRDAGVELD